MLLIDFECFSFGRKMARKGWAVFLFQVHAVLMVQ